MQKRYYLLPLLLILFFSCDRFTANDPDPVTVSGTVTNSSEDPIEEATVSILSPSPEESTTTDSEGVYTFSLLIEETTDFSLEISKDGYQTSTRDFSVNPSENISFPDVQLALTGEDNDEETVGGETGGAASIILQSVSETSINIAETGGNVNSTFTFVVQDSAGRAIDLDKAVDVQFLITQGPGGNEAITPEVVTTDSDGKVTASLFSGNIAGNVKVEALAERTDIELSIRSKPILLAIHGGFPDLDHFSISASIFNFEAFDINGKRNPIRVLVGDEFSNPVKPGTPVYFSTSGGVIQGSGQTDDDGEIEVDLISGDPRPTDGYATITAHTYDKNDNEITRDIQVLFSTAPSNNNITVSPETFNIPTNGSESFTMEITDRNGNPLPAETTITVEPAEGMDVEGDVEVTVPNALLGGPGVTEFTFTARDNDDESDASQDVSIVITVETPAGYTARKTIQGMKAKQF